MKINKGLLLPTVALLSATSLAVIASNNVAKFIKVIPEENSYFLRMDAGHNVFSIDNSTEIFDEDEYLDGYQMPVKNDNGYDIPFFFDDYIYEPEDEGFAAVEDCFEIHNLEAINGIKSITIKYANIRVCEGDYNPCLDQNVELPPDCVTEEQKKNFYCNYILTARPDWFDESYTVEDWWNSFLEEEGYSLSVDGHYPDGICSIKTDIKWGWELEDLEDDSLPYYTKNSFNNELTFDFFGTRPNYFSIGSEYLGYALDEDKYLAIESIIVEYTCNEGEKPSGYNNYNFTYVYHDDLNISDSWTDYATGSYIEITGPKNRENIESLVVPASIDSYPVTLIGEGAFYSCPNLSDVQLTSSVLELGNNSFTYCNIEEIILPEGLKCIGGNAFGYTSLSEIAFPESLEMFFGCINNTNVESLYFPKNVKYIDPYFDSMPNVKNVSIDDENPYYTDLDGTNTVLQICQNKEDGSTYYNVCGYFQTSVFKPGYSYLFEHYLNKSGVNWDTLDFSNITAIIKTWSLRSLSLETALFGPNISIEPGIFGSYGGNIKYIYLDRNVTLLTNEEADSPYYFDFSEEAIPSNVVIFINCDEGDYSSDTLELITGTSSQTELKYHKVVYLGDDATGLPANYKELAAA